MNIIIHLGIYFAYAMIGGIIGRMIWIRYRRAMGCWPKCKASHHDLVHHYLPLALAGGIFWPLTIPIGCGTYIGDLLTRSEERDARRKIKHDRKLAELEASRKLKEAERQKTLADIQFLVENGIHADVPGLYEDKS